MQQITVRLPEEMVEELEAEADEHDVSRSEHVRNVLESRSDVDELRDRLATREDRIEELETQLAERSRVEEKIEELPDKLRDGVTYQERRQRLLDEASLTERIKWKVTGVPTERVEGDN